MARHSFRGPARPFPAPQHKEPAGASTRFSNSLVELCRACLHDLRPLHDVGAKKFLEFVGRARHDFRAVVGQPLRNLGIAQYFDDFSVELMSPEFNAGLAS